MAGSTDAFRNVVAASMRACRKEPVLRKQVLSSSLCKVDLDSRFPHLVAGSPPGVKSLNPEPGVSPETADGSDPNSKCWAFGTKME